MYCTNCGNKVDDKAYVCVKCGVVIQRENNLKVEKRPKTIKKRGNETGIVSIIIASIGILISLYGFIFGNIDDVSIYTEIYEKVLFAFGFNLFQLLFMIVSFILSLINSKNKYNKVGFGLTLWLLFLILTEFVVIIIY